MGQKLQATKKCNNEIDDIANRFCLSFVHQGTTNASQMLLLLKCTTLLIREYEIIMKSWKKALKKKNWEELAPPPQCALSKNNIHNWGKAIFDAYKSEKNSLFSVIVDSPYWRKMLDWASKFNTEFKWIYIQGVHPDTWKPFLVAYCLRKNERWSHSLRPSRITFWNDWLIY